MTGVTGALHEGPYCSEGRAPQHGETDAGFRAWPCPDPPPTK